MKTDSICDLPVDDGSVLAGQVVGPQEIVERLARAGGGDDDVGRLVLPVHDDTGGHARLRW